MINKKRLAVIATTAIVLSSLTSCANKNVNGNTIPTSSSTTQQTSYTSVTTQSPSNNVESSTTTTDENVVETLQSTNPLTEYLLEHPQEYSYNATMILLPSGSSSSIEYGFDNPGSVLRLQEFVKSATGEENNDVTLSDVNYFQYIDEVSNNWNSMSFSESYGTEYFPEIYFESARAVLSSLGLRFGIDEIPASYIQARFPRFYYDNFAFGQSNKYLIEYGQPIEDFNTLCHPQDTQNEVYKDRIIFCACLNYNRIRANYIYKNPCGGGVVQQVRDTSTGKNVLVPTESQIEQLQQDINSIPGCENIDIFTPETPEQFFEIYGYYPSEILDVPVYGNTQEGFQEYYNSLPASEQYQIYATPPMTTMYTYTSSDDVYYVPDDYVGVYESATETEKGKGKSR